MVALVWVGELVGVLGREDCLLMGLVVVMKTQTAGPLVCGLARRLGSRKGLHAMLSNSSWCSGSMCCE